MSFMTALYDSYLYCEKNNFVNKSDKIDYETVLLPIYHSNKRSDGKNIIEITLNKESEIVDANFLIENEKIIFPITEESVGRCSGISPHSIVEEISYLIKEEKAKNDVYMENLDNWIEFLKKEKKEFKFLEIIQKFLKKEDFLEKIFKICYKDNFISFEKGKIKYLDNKNNEKSMDIKKIFLTFKIQNLFGDEKDYTVSNYKKLHNEYIEYMLEKENKNKKKICNISGKKLYCSSKHRGLLGTSKLISVSNHEETYYGRLKKGEEIVSIGYETSQKIHNMLKYFLENEKTCTYLGENSYLINWFSDDINNDENIKITGDLFTAPTVEGKDIADISNENVLKYLSGNYRNIGKESKYYIMIVNKVSNGRLSMKYFREMGKSDFYERISEWYKNIGWSKYNHNERKTIKKYPGIYKIVNYTYGIEREDKNKNKKIIFDQKKYRRDQIESLLTVMIDRKKIPLSIVKKMYSNICNRQRYDKTWNGLIEVACSVFKKYYIDYFNKEVSEEMEDKKNRDFLYGRLLAIFEKIEESTFGDEKRSTNAQKLWTAYINCPGKIMMTLIDKLQPYKRKLENNKRGSYIYFENLTQNIMMDLMNTEEFETNKNKKLKENFIFGYYYQRNEFFKSNKNN